MIIRQFEPDDFQGVLLIEMEAFSEHNPFLYINFYELNRDYFLVAEVGGSVVGYVVGYQLIENEGRIFSIAVKNEYKNCGIGTQLVYAIFNVFYRSAFQYVSLEVRASNTGAQKLYRRLGFVPCWIEEGYYSDNEDGIIMKMRLYPALFLNVLKIKEEVMPTRHEPAKILNFF